MEEAQLVVMLMQGSEAAYRDLYALYKDKVYNTALSMLQNTAEAEDTTQEAFIEVFRSISNFRGGAKLSTWIYRICVNKALEAIRHKKRKKRGGLVIGLFKTESVEPIFEAADFNHPGVQIEHKEQAAALFKAIALLPENQKTAFVLHHIEGLPYKEIVEIMGSSLSSVESLLFRAKQNMIKSLGHYYKTEMLDTSVN